MSPPGPGGGRAPSTSGGAGPAPRPRVLHVVVGHGLATYFLNAVRALRAAAPRDALLVIDNASPDTGLRAALAALGAEDERIEVVLRTENDVGANAKVGSLYSAYELAFRKALEGGYTLAHLVQGDMQTLWWDDEVVDRSLALYEEHPACVNLHTRILSRDALLAEELAPSAADGVLALRNYGLTDTGLYHLGRWRDLGMSFGPSEREHAARWGREGLEVLYHPWAMDAPIPWPAVVRGGVTRGREVRTGEPYLLRPPSPAEVQGVKGGAGPVWREDACIPWGWSCLTPMWDTDVDSIDYLVLRYRDARRNGSTRLLPRPELRGVGPGLRFLRRPFRPSLWRLFVLAPAAELWRRCGRLRRRDAVGGSGGLGGSGSGGSDPGAGG